MRRPFLFLLSFTIAMVLPAAAGAAIRLDPGFGSKGIVVLPGKKVPHRSAEKAVAIGPGGGLVIATNRTVRRLGPAGHLDRGFGDRGTVTPRPPAGGSFFITGATVDRRGRIVVVGISTPSQPHGSEVVTNYRDGEQPPDEAPRSDARILRFLPDGKPDRTFGDNGMVETDFGLPTPEYEGVKLAPGPAITTNGVAVDGNGNIIVTGGAVAGLTSGCYHDDFSSSLSSAAFVARLTMSGSPTRASATTGSSVGSHSPKPH